MNSALLSVESAGFALAGVAYLGYLAWLVHGRGATAWVHESMLRLYLLAVAFSGAWALMALVDLTSLKVWPAHAAEQFDQLRYAAWCLFLLSVGATGRQAAWAHRIFAFALLGVGTLANLWAGMSADEVPAAERSLAAVHLAWPILTVVLTEQVYRSEANHDRWGAKPLCLGLAALCAYDIFVYSEALMFGHPDPDALAARAFVHAFAVVLLVVASGRESAWMRRIRLSNTAAFYSASLLLVGIYLLGVAAIGYYVRFFGGTWGGVAQFVIAFGALLTLIAFALSGAFRARLRVFLGKHFLRYRYDYRREWLRFTAMLSARSSPQEVGVLVIRGLADMAESTGGSIWLRALGDDSFVQNARWNMAACPVQEAPDSEFCTFLREHEWIVDLREGGAPDGLAVGMPPLPEWLPALADAWLLVPLLVGNEMLGFVVLAAPRTALSLNWELRDLLKAAARQAAVFLSQMHATEALLEARKFDAFNRMSAFVVHDLKNIMTQLSLLLKNAARHKDNPEFQQDMLLTVESSLEKMRQMMMQLREGARPAGTVSGVELRPLLQRIADNAHRRGRTVELEIVDRVATRGDADRLERVIGHIVQNALDATPSSGRVWMTLRQVSGRAMLTVCDTGAGMDAEFVRTRLFRPFNSTKTSGMGIGSYESFQYVRELGGTIDVQSEVGRGTQVALLMPLFDLRIDTDLRAVQAK